MAYLENIMLTKNIKQETFKGKPVLTLNHGENFLFSFGLKKARLILACIDEIRGFVEFNDD